MKQIAASKILKLSGLSVAASAAAVGASTFAAGASLSASSTADASDGAAPPSLQDREAYVLSRLSGTPSEHEAPRDILANNPDYVVFVPRQPRNAALRDPRKTGDTYNDHFQVVCNPTNGHYYAFWTQANKEGDIDHHVAFSKSLDGGYTWTEPVLVAGSPCRARPMAIASWQQPMLSKSGRLYCLWCQQVTGRGLAGALFGVYSDDEGETWSAPRDVTLPRTDADDPDPTKPAGWIQWQRPLRQGPQGQFFVATSRHGKAPYDDAPKCKIEFWQYENIDDNPNVEDIKVTYFATNRDALDVSKMAGGPYFKPAREGEALEEASVVKLPDGRLFAVMRSSIGHPVWTQSRDGGRTWSGPKALLDHDGGKPYLHPRSPCPMYDWKGEDAASGMYFVLVHNKFDFQKDYAYQDRGPLYLIAGRFNPAAKDQPVEFSEPKMFAPRANGNSFYSSYTVHDGKGILWFNDMKFYLLGREVGPEWFDEGARATVDFAEPLGRGIRALNGGNLGPNFSKAGTFGNGTNDFAALRVPMTRLHDVPLANAGMRLVDVQHIFGNESADPHDPNNYYFTQTDDYLARIRSLGTEIMYRLGPSIEHSEADYYTKPPTDYEKYAEVCLGIVRHYNAGWANGHKWNIRYWEIWNEFDIGKRMWTGTTEEFCRLYETVAKKIKAEFPDVKVGGPSFARFHPDGVRNFSEDKAREFLAYCRDRKVPLDFFSWHRYGCDLKPLVEEPALMRKVLDSYGFTNTELILDEWHYWPPDGFKREIMSDPVNGLASANAAAFAVAAMVGWQDSPLDMSCHYTIGGLHDYWGAWDEMNARTKLFYALRSFAAMRDYPQRVSVASNNGDLQILAGTNAAGKRAVLVVNFKTGAERIRLTIKGAEGVRFSCTTLDEGSDEAKREVAVEADGTLWLDGAQKGRSSVTLLTEL